MSPFLTPMPKPRPTCVGIRHSPLKTAHLAKTGVQRGCEGDSGLLEGVKIGCQKTLHFLERGLRPVASHPFKE